MQTTSVVAVMFSGFVLSGIIAFHPFVSRHRHPESNQTIAYLLFVAVFVIVSSAIFLAEMHFGNFIQPGFIDAGLVPAMIVILAALLPGFLVASWYVARPPLHLMSDGHPKPN